VLISRKKTGAKKIAVISAFVQNLVPSGCRERTRQVRKSDERTTVVFSYAEAVNIAADMAAAMKDFMTI
jgi:hypothetical protein